MSKRIKLEKLCKESGWGKPIKLPPLDPEVSRRLMDLLKGIKERKARIKLLEEIAELAEWSLECEDVFNCPGAGWFYDLIRGNPIESKINAERSIHCLIRESKSDLRAAIEKRKGEM